MPPTGITIERLVLLVSIAALVAMGAKKIKIPYTIALVLVGLLLSVIQVFPPVHLTEGLVLFIFLPALLFEAAWNLNLAYLKQYWPAILLLAVGGLLVSVGVVGAVLHGVLGVPLLLALLFGATISATDPVSVLGLFRVLSINPRLATLVEAESLYNDGTAVVVFKILLAMVMMGSALPSDGWGGLLFGGVLQFAGVVLGGMLVGGILGGGLSLLSKNFDDAFLELTFTTIAAYGSFVLADQLVLPGKVPGIHLSGVIATITAGLVMGTLCRRSTMSATTQVVVTSFWEYAAFLVNSIIFLLIGLEIQIGFLVAHGQAILVAIAAVMAGRVVSVYGLLPLLRGKTVAPIPVAWRHILVWGGLRGALSMALVLSLPLQVPGRSLLIAMVFGVVLFSLVGQGLTMPCILKKLHLDEAG